VNEEPIAGEASAPTVPAGNVGPAGHVGPAEGVGPAREAGPAGEAAAAAETEAPGAEGQARPADIWSDPRLPWEGKPRRVDVICWAAITLSGLYYLIILPFRASLVRAVHHLVEARRHDLPRQAVEHRARDGSSYENAQLHSWRYPRWYAPA